MLDSAQSSPRQLRDAFGCFASGVTVVTLRDCAGAPTGITVNSFSSLSLDPPLLMFSVGCRQVSCRWFEAGEHFNVNVLGSDQEMLAWQFARPLEDKFAGVAWHESASGMPVLNGALASFACRKWQMLDGGDHRIVIGRVEDFSAREGEALLFYRGGMRRTAGGEASA